MAIWRRCRISAVTFLVLAGIAAGPLAATAQYASFGPLLPAERNSTETSRDVAAPDYRDAYCAKWNDGCSSCQRSNANEQPTCKPLDQRTDACVLRPIQCEAVLKSIHRVCFSYGDGCNRCVNHMCTLIYCPGKQTNYQCARLRTAQFQPGDVTGHWRLTRPDQRTCELVLDGYVTLTGSCLALGSPITHLAQTKLDGGVLRFLGPDNEPLLSFDTSNPDDLRGVESAQGYHLVRIEPGTIYPFQWEGTWELHAENSITCDIFLSMRRQLRGPRASDVRISQGVAFQSGCVSDANTFRFSRARQQKSAIEGTRRTIHVVEEPLSVPLWTEWRHEAFDLTFRDATGRETVFKRQEDGAWRAEVNAGDKPLVLLLKRKRG